MRKVIKLHYLNIYKATTVLKNVRLWSSSTYGPHCSRSWTQLFLLFRETSLNGFERKLEPGTLNQSEKILGLNFPVIHGKILTEIFGARKVDRSASVGVRWWHSEAPLHAKACYWKRSECHMVILNYGRIWVNIKLVTGKSASWQRKCAIAIYGCQMNLLGLHFSLTSFDYKQGKYCPWNPANVEWKLMRPFSRQGHVLMTFQQNELPSFFPACRLEIHFLCYHSICGCM